MAYAKGKAVSISSVKGLIIMYTNNDILFPHRVIASLRDKRGDQWTALVDHVMSLPENHEDTLAFMLMMIRLNNCMSCETDSYRAMRGCETCALQTLKRFREADEVLLARYQDALAEVRQFAHQQERFDIIVESVGE